VEDTHRVDLGIFRAAGYWSFQGKALDNLALRIHAVGLSGAAL
jgi:hypothetical protein